MRKDGQKKERQPVQVGNEGIGVAQAGWEVSWETETGLEPREVMVWSDPADGGRSFKEDAELERSGSKGLDGSG